MTEFNVNKNEVHYHGSGGSFWDNVSNFFKKNKKINKTNLRILFIDDNKFPVIANLKKADYQVEWIRDIKKTDDTRVVDAHIIFVDYKGVGKNLSNKEGVGVCGMLKNEYGTSKYIILISAENIPNDLIQELKTASDDILTKNNDTADYIKVIENGLQKIKQ